MLIELDSFITIQVNDVHFRITNKINETEFFIAINQPLKKSRRETIADILAALQLIYDREP